VSNNTNLLLTFIRDVLDVFVFKLLTTRSYIWIIINIRDSLSLFNNKSVNAIAQVVLESKSIF